MSKVFITSRTGKDGKRYSGPRIYVDTWEEAKEYAKIHKVKLDGELRVEDACYGL